MSKSKNYISYSQIEDGKCPHKYFHLRIKKDIKKPLTQGLEVGRFKHDLVNDYVMYCKNFKNVNQKGETVSIGTDGDIDIMKKMFDAKWDKYNIDEESRHDIYEEMLEFGEKGVNPDSILQCEEEIDIEFYPGMWVKMKIDITRIYNFRGLKKSPDNAIFHVIDYKNQANILKASDTLSNQLKIYTLGCYKKYPGYQYYRRGIYYLKYNFIRYAEDEDNPIHITDIEQEIDETIEFLVRQWKKLKTSTDEKDFPAITGEHCYQWEGCPLLLAGKCPEIKGRPEGIEEKIRDIFQMKTRSEKLKKEVKAWIKLNGNIKVDNRDVGFVETLKSKYDFNKILQLCDRIPYSLELESFPVIIANKIKKDIGKKLDSESLMKEFEKCETVSKETKMKIV